jgi:hypothetical protein
MKCASVEHNHLRHRGLHRKSLVLQFVFQWYIMIYKWQKLIEWLSFSYAEIKWLSLKLINNAFIISTDWITVCWNVLVSAFIHKWLYYFGSYFLCIVYIVNENLRDIIIDWDFIAKCTGFHLSLQNHLCTYLCIDPQESCICISDKCIWVFF